MANQTRLLGFNFRRIEVERQDQSPEKVDIVSDIKFENVEKHRVDLVNEEALKIDFEFKLTYKDFAKLSMQGAIILMVDDKAFKDALKEWKKNKKLPKDLNQGLINLILQKCSLRALQLEEEMGIPLHIQMPKVKIQDPEQSGN
jgi:hypothetical protein